MTEIQVIGVILGCLLPGWIIIHWKALSLSWLGLIFLLGPLGLIILLFIPSQRVKKES